MWRIPNFITGLRLGLALLTFFCLAGAALLSDKLTPATQFMLERIAFYRRSSLAALTDFVDGWIARRLNAVTIWGRSSTRSPTRCSVCGVVLGPVLTLGGNGMVAIPAALILFREFTVSALKARWAAGMRSASR